MGLIGDLFTAHARQKRQRPDNRVQGITVPGMPNPYNRARLPNEPTTWNQLALSAPSSAEGMTVPPASLRTLQSLANSFANSNYARDATANAITDKYWNGITPSPASVYYKNDPSLQLAMASTAPIGSLMSSQAREISRVPYIQPAEHPGMAGAIKSGAASAIANANTYGQLLDDASAALDRQIAMDMPRAEHVAAKHGTLADLRALEERNNRVAEFLQGRGRDRSPYGGRDIIGPYSGEQGLQQASAVRDLHAREQAERARKISELQDRSSKFYADQKARETNPVFAVQQDIETRSRSEAGRNMDAIMAEHGFNTDTPEEAAQYRKSLSRMNEDYRKYLRNTDSSRRLNYNEFASAYLQSGMDLPMPIEDARAEIERGLGLAGTARNAERGRRDVDKEAERGRNQRRRQGAFDAMMLERYHKLPGSTNSWDQAQASVSEAAPLVQQTAQAAGITPEQFISAYRNLQAALQATRPTTAMAGLGW